MKMSIARASAAILSNNWDCCSCFFRVAALLVCCSVGLRAQTLSLTSKDFGSVALGFSNSVNVTLTNSSSPLTISGITTTAGFSQTSNCPISPLTLAASAKCTITVSFNPVALGVVNGTLAVNDSASNSPQSASLTGTGIAQVVFSTTNLGMGSVPINTTSAAKTVTLKNAQPIPLTIASIGISGNFAQTSNCPLSPSTLAASTSCTISVTFTPTVAGTNSGTLTVTDDASTSPQSIPVTGTGTGSASSSVSLSPATQNFGSVSVGSSSISTFTLANGANPLTITSIATTGNYSPASNCPTSPQALAANTSCTITVTFNPGTTGTLTGTLTVTDSASNSPQTATLTGTGTSAGGSTASLSPTSQSFGSVNVGSSNSENFTLTNGGSALTISSIGATGNYSQTSNCPISPQTLAANGQCTITVTFNPGTTGTLTGTLTVTDSASNSPQTATLTGTGTNGSTANLAPASQNLGSVTVGSSGSATFTLTNGTSALTITSIATTGNYSQTSNCPSSPQTLTANGQCTITVSFNPATTGTLTGTLTVTDSASNSPQTSLLTGTGGAGSSSVTLTPATKGFGQVAIGSSNSLNFTLTNTTTPLTISSIATTGNFSETSNCPTSPQTLAANASCTITVSFSPASTGALTGTLTVTDSASNSPQTSNLTGTGVLAVGLSPGGLAMGSETVDTTSASKAITLTNNQSTALTISSISISGAFGQTSNCPMSPSTLATNASCTISVTFSPTVGGTVSGTLTITDNAPSSPQTASLTGTGVLPVTLSSSALTFSSQLITTTSSSQSVTLKNAQSIALTISSISTTGNFAQTSTCPISPNTLASAATCKISVTFTPTTVGTLTGTLTVNDDAPTSTQTVGLTGTGSLTGLSAISISPVNPTVPLGSQVQLAATGTFPSKQLINITNFVTWSSFAPEYAPINASGLAQGVAVGTATITASSGSYSGQTSVTVGEPTVTSVSVSPSGSSIAVGSYEQFVATLNYSDGSSKQQTTGVTWTSSASNVASISSSGLVGGLSAGTTTVQASIGALSGSTSLSATQPSCSAAPSGVIGWWTGDGNTVDIAGSNSGTLQNGATYGNGEVGQAFTFSGNGASVLVNAPVYSPAAGTLMFWFLSTGGGYMTGSEMSGLNRAPGFWIDSGNNLYWEFGDLSAQPLGQLNPNQWYHVALTYSGANSAVNVNVYLDGALVATALADANAAWSQQVEFGAYLGAQQPSFVGSMDEIAIFNQALSLQQIEQIYGAYSGGMCKPTLQSIAVNPSTPTVAPGMTQQFTAAGTYSNTTTHDVTSSATWNTDNVAVATINPTGLVTAIANGLTNVSAVLGTVSGSTVLTVAPTLVSIQVNPQNPAAASGTTQPFTATGTFTDGTQRDVTSSVTWSSSSTAVATISSGGTATCVAAGQTTITAAAGSVTASTLLTVTPGTLTSITVTPANPTIAATTAQQFTATGNFSDGSQQNITSTVTWSSSSTDIAAINSNGLATGLAAGQTTITATSGSISNTATLTVTSATLTSISVTPANPSASLGNTVPFTATGNFSDGSNQNLTGVVSWTSSNQAVATINSSGLASTLSAGSTTISAALDSVSGSTGLSVGGPALVSLVISPGNSTLQIGQNLQLTAIGTYTDGSQQNLTQLAQWNSTASSTVSVSASGLAGALSGGSASITASVPTVPAASATLNVNSLALVSMAVTPANPAIALGTNQQFIATGTYADGSTLNLTASAAWASSSTSIAGINAQGMASAVNTGQTTITATAAGLSGSDTLTVTPATLVSITVTPMTSAIAMGTTEQFDATGVFSDGTTQDVATSVQWSSSQSAVASVSNASGSQGLATSIAAGSTTIAAAQSGVTGSATLTVDNASLVSIAVAPANPSIALGTTQQFTATGTFTDGTQQDLTSTVTWASANVPVATITTSGLATSTAVGTATIIATLAAVSGSTPVTVTPAVVVSVTVSPATAAVPSGISQPFTAQAKFTDGSTQDVTAAAHWSSSVSAVATVSNSSGNNGLANTFSSGSSTVAATLGSVSGSGNLTVTSAVLAAIQITPLSPTVPLGGTGQLNATGIYTDGSSNNITALVTWSSSTPPVAIVSNAAGTQGLATGTSSGSTIISATFGALLDSTVMNVDDQVITITVAPTSAVVNQGATQQFAAIATYNSGAQLDLTNAVVWTSSSPSVATVSVSGLATSSAAGQAIITATLGSFTSSANLTVSQTLSVSTPTHPRADISDGTTGQLFISWDSMQGATYYNLQRSTSASSGFALVSACSGASNISSIETNSGSMACRDATLTPGTTYYYRVAACNASGCSNYSSVVSNIPITSDCTSTQMPNLSGIKILPPVSVAANVADPTVTFLPTTDEYAAYAAPSIPRQNMLVVELPGSGGTCDIGNVGQVAERLGFDVICVNYSNATEQINICTGDVNCFGNISQAKLDGTGPCSVPQSSVCGIDPSTKQPYVNSNPADAVTQRISMLLQYLNNNGYNQNGTNWGAYLSGTAPLWSSIIIGGFSQGGDMATFAAYEQPVARSYNLSGPPQATPVNGVMTGAAYFTQMTPVTNIRNIYGFVSVNDPLYSNGDYFAVWAALGFTVANNDAEEKLNTSTPVGVTCNAGTPSHNFSTSALVSPGGGHTDTLYLWNEDVYKFLLID